MTSEIAPATNLLNRVLDKIKINEEAKSTSKLAVIISALSLVISSLISISAWNDAKHARITVEHQQKYIDELEDDLGVYRIRAAKLNAWLVANGIDTGEIYK